MLIRYAIIVVVGYTGYTRYEVRGKNAESSSEDGRYPRDEMTAIFVEKQKVIYRYIYENAFT